MYPPRFSRHDCQSEFRLSPAFCLQSRLSTEFRRKPELQRCVSTAADYNARQRRMQVAARLDGHNGIDGKTRKDILVQVTNLLSEWFGA